MNRRAWSARDREEILNAHQQTCFLCGQNIDRSRGLDFDHLIPLRLGGTDTKDNLRPVCRPCHRQKTKADQKTIGKTRRIEQKSWGIKSVKGRTLQSRGFDRSAKASKGPRILKTPLPRTSLYRKDGS